MVNDSRIWYWRLTCLVGVWAGLSLNVRAGAAEGDAPNRQPPEQPAIEQRGAMDVLLNRLEKEIAEDHLLAPPGDNVDATIEAIIALLPSAPASDFEMVLNMPEHLRQRAREAEAAGHHDEAKRFAVLGDSLRGTTLREGAGDQPEPMPEPRQPGTAAGATPATANQSSSNVGDSSLQLNLSTLGGAGKPLPVPDGLLASRKEAPTPTGGGSAQPSVSGIVVYPDRAARGRAVGRAAAMLASPMRRTASPSAVPPPPSKAAISATNSRCRAITLKFAIGEEPSEAERNYLRDGCQHG